MGNANKTKRAEDKASSAHQNPNLSAVENKLSNNNHVNDYNLMGPNDNLSKIKQSLKYLHKNNFSSLTFEDLNAYFIQLNWKQHIMQKNKEKKRGMIEVIYSSLDRNPNVTSRQDRLFVSLDFRLYPYRCYDLMAYKSLKSAVENFGGFENLPAVFINNYYIGSYDSYQELEDLKLTNSILNKEYTRRCLMCNMIKMDKDLDTCPYCYKSYTFFAKNENLLSVHKNRNNSGKLEYIAN